jgi:hypothetical protein
MQLMTCCRLYFLRMQEPSTIFTKLYYGMVSGFAFSNDLAVRSVS